MKLEIWGEQPTEELTARVALKKIAGDVRVVLKDKDGKDVSSPVIVNICVIDGKLKLNRAFNPNGTYCHTDKTGRIAEY